MQRVVATGVVLLAMGAVLYGQGTIVFNNLDKSDGEVSLFPTPASPMAIPLNQDVNFILAAGLPGGPINFVRSWLLSDGTANGINQAGAAFVTSLACGRRAAVKA
jgi:hypothetical protein